MKKKLIAAMLTVTMMVGLCTGCGKETTTSESSDKQTSEESTSVEDTSAEETVSEDETSGWLVDEETKLSVLFASNYEMDENTWIFQKIKECTGIAIEPICYSPEVAQEKLSTYIASENIPDIVFNIFPEVNKYGEVGALASPMDYLDIMPNFKSLIIDDPDTYTIYESYNAPNGKNYSIPTYGLNRDVNFGIMYRADVFEELGIEAWAPGDTEAFYEALVTLKEAYPDSYPLTACIEANYTLMRWAASWTDTHGVLDCNDGIWSVSVTKDEYKEFLDFFQKLYTEGLMDPEFFSGTVDSYNDAFLNDRSFVCNEWIGRMALLNTAAKELDADTSFDLVYGAPIGNGKVPALGKLGYWGNVVANNENTEVSMKLMDWLYSDEASELYTIGAEGENFVWNEDGKPEYLELDASEVSITSLEEKYGMWIAGMYLRPDRRSCYYNFTDHEKAAQDMINNECGYVKLLPNVVIDPEYVDEYNTLLTKLDTDAYTFTAKYIANSNYGDKEWQEFVETITADCSDRILEILNN